jgi:hypothetical protein
MGTGWTPCGPSLSAKAVVRQSRQHLLLLESNARRTWVIAANLVGLAACKECCSNGLIYRQRSLHIASALVHGRVMNPWIRRRDSEPQVWALRTHAEAKPFAGLLRTLELARRCGQCARGPAIQGAPGRPWTMDTGFETPLPVAAREVRCPRRAAPAADRHMDRGSGAERGKWLSARCRSA